MLTFVIIRRKYVLLASYFFLSLLAIATRMFTKNDDLVMYASNRFKKMFA